MSEPKFSGGTDQLGVDIGLTDLPAPEMCGNGVVLGAP
jgi:hypothetical protein